MKTKQERKEQSLSRPSFLHELFHTKRLGAFGLCLLIFFLLVAVFADFLAPVKEVNGMIPTSVLDKLLPPSLAHPFGTDSVGRDVLSYMIYGCRTSVILGIVCTILSTIVSLVIGVASAVIGGWFDLIVQRIVDGWQCAPGMLIMLILMSILGNGLIQLIIVIAIGIMVFASAMLGDGVRDILDPRLKGGVGSYSTSKIKRIVEQKKRDMHIL